MSSSAAAEEHPRPVQVLFGDTMAAARRRTMALASYSLFLILVILAAFVRYLWIALAAYCALLVAFSCVSRAFSAPPPPPAAAASSSPAAAQQRGRSHGAGGLSAAAIASVAPAFPYVVVDDARRAAGEAAVRCAVCMETVNGGEEVRRLPACAHAFHVGCIDIWLRSHATCPVCRCRVVTRKGWNEPLQLPAVQQLPEPPLPPV